MNNPPILKEKDKKKKYRKKTTSQLKKILDTQFSLFIRNKYSTRGYVRCYTCDKRMLIKESQCGHFVSRSCLTTRYDERNCRVQCVGCNVFGKGMTMVFANKLEEENQGIVAELYREARKIVKNFPYEEKIKYYTDKLKEF